MSNLKALLVDDSKSARYALRVLLQKQDFDVDTAENAEVALEKIKAHPPEVVFMDHLMPGMNGFEALDVLKQDSTTAHIPVVMCTSNDEDHYQREAREKGALGILPKPATPDKLADIMNAIEQDIWAHAQDRTAAAAPVPEPIAPAPAVDSDLIADLVREQLPTLLRSELSSLLERELPTRVDALREQLQPAVVQAVKVQLEKESLAAIDRRLEDGLVQLRTKLTTEMGADATPNLDRKIDAAISALKAELVHGETDHMQSALDKLSHEVLPETIDNQMARFKSDIDERIDDRLVEFSSRIPEELLAQQALVQQLNGAAEAAAERKAQEVAANEARAIAQSVATERAASLAPSSQHLVGRMYLLAGVAAVVGIAAAFVVNMLF